MEYVVIRVTHEDKEMYIVKETDGKGPTFDVIGGVYDTEEQVFGEGGYIINVPSLTLEVTAEEFAKWEHVRMQVRTGMFGIKKYVESLS